MLVAEVGTAEFESRLEAYAAESGDAVRGFVGPGSMSWRINREAALHAAGPRALLLQFAHPLVAQGVADHSNFRKDLLGRTVRTFSTVYQLVFGSREEALRSARVIHAVHKRVRGKLPHAAGRHTVGTPYAANNPALLKWVWATLIDGAVFAYERFVRTMTPGEREGFYHEGRSLSRLFGLSMDDWPDDWNGFARWFDATLASDEIAVSPTAFELAQVFLTGRTGLKPLSPVFRVLAAGTLPPAIRDAFGVRWDVSYRAAFGALSSAVRTGVRVLPDVARVVPFAAAAERRCRVDTPGGRVGHPTVL